jgi:hypothetical protein
MDVTMSACPQCGNDVRPVWPSCRSCGALLIAPPAPVVAVGAAAPTGPSTEEQFFAPAVFRAPVTVAAPPSFEYATAARPDPSGASVGKWVALGGMVILLVVAIAIAALAIEPGAKAKAQTPVVLAPKPPVAGLTPDLGAIVRVEAESARHTALQTVASVESGDPAALAAAQPDYKWVAGNQPSADPHTVSVLQNTADVTIAVAATNHDVCAFGRWAKNTTPIYVTMGHQQSCAAVNAPTIGWSTQPGGAASDLPDDNG